MENKNENGFRYSYSAKEQEELQRIREKYLPREEEPMERLRRLDRGVTKKAQTVALIFGILGTLVLGFGMSLAMTDLAGGLGIPDSLSMILGVVIGLVGGLMVSLAYPIYNAIVARERRRIAPEIIRLSNELLK